MIRAHGGPLTTLLVATGLLICASAPLRANDAADTEATATEQTESAGKPIALNKFTKRKRSGKQVARAPKSRVIAKGYRRKAIDADAAPNAVPMADSEPATISDNVANAKAQWPAPDTSVQPVTTPPAAPSASPDVVAADQLNDLDRKLATPASGDDAASQIATKMASQVAQNASQAAGDNVPTTATPAVSATATPAMSAMASADKPVVAGDDNSAWGQSSLIGKIFIALGGLLTVASAARMFMA